MEQYLGLVAPPPRSRKNPHALRPEMWAIFNTTADPDDHRRYRAGFAHASSHVEGMNAELKPVCCCARVAVRCGRAWLCLLTFRPACLPPMLTQYRPLSIDKLTMVLLNKCATDAADRCASAAAAVDLYVNGRGSGKHKTTAFVRAKDITSVLRPGTVEDIEAKVAFMSLTSSARVTKLVRPQ